LQLLLQSISPRSPEPASSLQAARTGISETSGVSAPLTLADERDAVGHETNSTLRSRLVRGRGARPRRRLKRPAFEAGRARRKWWGPRSRGTRGPIARSARIWGKGRGDDFHLARPAGRAVMATAWGSSAVADRWGCLGVCASDQTAAVERASRSALVAIRLSMGPSCRSSVVRLNVGSAPESRRADRFCQFRCRGTFLPSSARHAHYVLACQLGGQSATTWMSPAADRSMETGRVWSRPSRTLAKSSLANVALTKRSALTLAANLMRFGVYS